MYEKFEFLITTQWDPEGIIHYPVEGIQELRTCIYGIFCMIAKSIWRCQRTGQERMEWFVKRDGWLVLWRWHDYCKKGRLLALFSCRSHLFLHTVQLWMYFLGSIIYPFPHTTISIGHDLQLRMYIESAFSWLVCTMLHIVSAKILLLSYTFQLAFLSPLLGTSLGIRWK